MVYKEISFYEYELWDSSINKELVHIMPLTYTYYCQEWFLSEQRGLARMHFTYMMNYYQIMIIIKVPVLTWNVVLRKIWLDCNVIFCISLFIFYRGYFNILLIGRHLMYLILKFFSNFSVYLLLIIVLTSFWVSINYVW